MRKILALLLFGAFFNSAHSQVKWGANGGLNISNTSSSGQKPLLTFQFSGIAMIPISHSLAVQPSLGYRGKGYKIKSRGSTEHINVLYNYVQLTTPVLLKCNADDKYKIYAGAGPYFAYFVNGKWDGSLLRNDNFHRVDLGLDLSLLLIIRERWTLAMSSDIGFIGVYKSVKSANINSGITIGYLF